MLQESKDFILRMSSDPRDMEMAENQQSQPGANQALNQNMVSSSTGEQPMA